MKGKNKMTKKLYTTNEALTEDLSKFGYQELQMAMDLIDAIKRDGLPETFIDDNVRICFNTHTGAVFLINSDLQVCMDTTKENGTGVELFIVHTLKTSEYEYQGSIEDLIYEWSDLNFQEREEVIEIARQERKLHLIPDNDLLNPDEEIKQDLNKDIIEQLEGL